MSQGRFSTYVLLVGLLLIEFNTILMLAKIGYEFVVLVISLIWAVVSQFGFLICNYPFTSVSWVLIIYVTYYCKSHNKSNQSNFQHFLLKIFSSGEQCAICFQSQVDFISQGCGHFYHLKCIKPLVKYQHPCKDCQQRISHTNTYKFSPFRYLKYLLKSNKLKFLVLFIITFLVGYFYTCWYSSLQILPQIK